MPPTRERRWWTTQEDDVLKHGVQIQYGSVQNWSEIAAFLPGRTNKDCRKRWSKVKWDIRKGAWTQDEDERLQRAVHQLGFKWSQVAIMIQSRNADQCAKRWQHVLRPDFKHSPWTSEEDRKLVEAMRRQGNNWKQIGLESFPDRSTHNIRNRSLVLGRRRQNMLGRGSMSAQQSSPSSNDDDDDVVSDGLDDYEEGDSGAYNPGSRCEHTGSARLQQPLQLPSGVAFTQQDTALASESGIISPSMTHFQQPHTPMEIPSSTPSSFDSNPTGATGQAQTYRELPTPSSGCLSWFDPLDASTSTVADSQPLWWTKSPVDGDSSHNSEPFDVEFLDMPGSSDDSRMRGNVDSNGGNAISDKEGKGSVTLTLSQVDSDVVQEIMGSVLKYSAGLKIRCIVNDD